MRLALYLTVILLLATQAHAAVFNFDDAMNIEDPRVIVTYTKEVHITDSSLISLNPDNTAEYILETDPVIPDGTFSFSDEYELVALSPDGEQQALIPGRYQITIDAIDREGRRTLDIVNFFIEGLDIIPIEPPFGISQHIPFDLYFVTMLDGNPEDARCSYSKTGFDTLQQISGAFVSDHTITGLNYRGSLYLSCEETTGRMTQKILMIDFDSTAPTINAQAQPDVVKDPRYRSTAITVETDDKSVCNLDGEPFPDESTQDRESYGTVHERAIYYNDITDTNEHHFTYAVSCVNLAGLTSTASANVTVNFGDFDHIIVHSPAEYIASESFDLVVEPTFDADSCTADGDPMTQDGSRFALPFDAHADGEHTVELHCVGARDATRDYTFHVDIEDPQVSIDAPGFFCSNSLIATIDAQDNEGILGFNYTVRDEEDVFGHATTVLTDISVPLDRPIEGELVWSVVAWDRAGNTGSAGLVLPHVREGTEEECGLPPFIRLLEPNLGFAFSAPYLVRLGTTRSADCRYSLQPGVDYSSRGPFDTIDHLLHSRQFDFSDQVLYTWCQEPSLKNHTKPFRVGVDTSAPLVSITTVPETVVDPANKIVVMTITTSDPTHCTLDGDDIDSSYPDPTSYTDEHVKTLDFRSITSTVPQSFTYTITCNNLANLSTTKAHTVLIDLGAGLSIARVSPELFTASTSVVLAVRPNMESTCMWSESANGTKTSFDLTAEGVHSVQLGNLPEGSHQYFVECTSVTERGSAAFGFTVERTPPEIIDLVGAEAMCEDASLKVTYNITGLDKAPVISYTIEGSANASFAKNTSDPFITIEDLLPGEYTLKLTPIGRTGLVGAAKQLSFTVLAEESEECSVVEPVCGDGSFNAVGELCDGTDLGGMTCKRIGFSSGTLKCTANCLFDTSSCVGTEPAVCGDGIVSPTESCDGTNLTGLRCSDLSAFIGGSLSCSACQLNTTACELPDIPASCMNGKRDTGETNIDCGGLCPACIACSLDSECPQGKICSLGVCVTEPDPIDVPLICSNGVRDGLEEGVDCGGSCPSCIACTTDLDCPSSMICSNSICRELGGGWAPPPDGEKNESPPGPPITSGNRCEVDTECNLDEICVGGRCQRKSSTPPTTPPFTPPPETSGGADWLALTLIILGVVVMGGAGYFLYEEHENKGMTGMTGMSGFGGFDGFGGTPPETRYTPPGAPSPSQPQQQGPSQEEIALARAQEHARDDALEQARERKQERATKRHALFDTFGGDGSGAPAAPQKGSRKVPSKGQQKDQQGDQQDASKKDTQQSRTKPKPTKSDEVSEDVFDELEKI